eukprot:CAMPEP_0174856518 /NCGR_PEP_ID=MMETSP1114-20130205/36078_1 /TAXON_ID=312471 /ORGANISM="Neobodo designis, Strain CCAP 1951/1" /LENGTH=707 /DNA_ID=CAMNT_0016091317 /DNA_START=73 /DNA_END=2196 /DNA_ORIENTATION=-
MSKHGRALYDEDDYDDYDDYDDDGEYYEEDAYDARVAAPAKAAPKAAAKPAAKSSSPAKAGGKNPQPPPASGKLQAETPAQLAAGKGSGFAAAAAPSPGTAKRSLVEEVQASEAEREVLMAVLPNVTAVVGSMVPQSSIIAALRKANYDADAAVSALLAEDFSEEPAPDARPAASPTIAASEAFAKPSTTPPPFGAKKTGSKKIVLGGSTPQATTSPQAASPQMKSPADGPSNAASPGAVTPALQSTAASPTANAHAYFPTAEAKHKCAVADDDGKMSISLVMAGHVDTGKSTILGHLLVKLGHFTEREVAKLEAQARAEGKATFHFAWILDQSPEERRRGVTIDSGVHAFETEHRRVSVLDAPGHKDYVSSMISSATQADIALFTVSASNGEFESGLAHMTREHLSIIKTLGLTNVVVLVNKMDTVEYSQARFEEVKAKVTELAQSMRFRESSIAGFCPVSGFHAVNLLPGTAAEQMPWYSGPSLVEYVDTCKPAQRMLQYPLRLVISDIAKQVVTGKVETGTVKVGDPVVAVPSGNKLTVRSIERPNVGATKTAQAGNSVDVTVQGDLLGVVAGDVICPPKQRCPVSSTFEAHVQLFGNLPKVVLPGTKMLLQMHAVNTMATVKRLVKKMDPKTGQWSASRFVKCLPANTQGLIEFELPHAMPLELAEDNRVLGRFVLRLEDETVGGGLITAIGNVAPPAAPAAA